jgi:hypothetical protein
MMTCVNHLTPGDVEFHDCRVTGATRDDNGTVHLSFVPANVEITDGHGWAPCEPPGEITLTFLAVDSAVNEFHNVVAGGWAADGATVHVGFSPSRARARVWEPRTGFGLLLAVV